MKHIQTATDSTDGLRQNAYKIATRPVLWKIKTLRN